MCVFSNEKPSTAQFPALPANPTWTVATSSGSVRGADLNGGIAFLGLPYAGSPVGEHRWAAPRPVEPWTGVLECTRFGPVCPQGKVPGVAGPDVPAAATEMLPAGMDEDCLQLNVYTPSLEGRHATVVWFHGGNLTGGSSSDGFAYDPTARKGQNPSFFSQDSGLVVVTVTYRLNIFGFLNLEGAAGNCGLLDAAAALSWVRREIRHFGGDPENVTILGQSAGAHVCSQLLAMREAAGLFHKAICMSGSAQWSLGSQEEHNRRIAGPFAKQLGFESLQEMTLEKARQFPAERLRQAYLASRSFLESGTLTIDGVTVPRDPLDMFLEGYTKGVPILSGVTRDEGVWSTRLKKKGCTMEDAVADVKRHLSSGCYLTAADLNALREVDEQALEKVAGELIKDYQDLADRYAAAPAEAQQKAVNLANDKNPQVGDELYELVVKALGDHDFTVPHTMATWALSRHAPVYGYVFSDASQPNLEARYVSHGADVKFLFGTDSARPVDEQGSQAQAELSATVMEAFAAFARTGNPSTPTLGEWPLMRFPELPSSSASQEALPRLPEVPQGMEHMHLEYGNMGVVTHGWEETRIWFKHALRLGKLLAPPGGESRVRPSLAAMAAAMYGDLLQ